MPQLPIAEIHDDPTTNVRRLAASAAQDEALTASIRAQGVLQPLLVRPNGNGYKIIFGRRRLRCAAAAGLTEVPVIVAQMTDAWAIAADAAENMARAALHPLDQWRAVAALVNAHMTLPEAAAALGLDERQTRRMDRLGRLHPDVMALVEHQVPDDRYLAAIAMADPADQAKAAKTRGAVDRAKGQITYVAWHVIRDALRITRLSRSRALFDAEASGLAWEEDFFAEPGSPEQFTTTDVRGFFKRQHAAVEALAEARRAKKQTVEILDPHPDKLPKGYTEVWDSDRDKPKRGHTVFLSIDANGTMRTRLATHDATEKAAAKKRAERAVDTRDNDGADDGESAPEAAPKLPITKTGQKAIAAVKTEALQKALGERLAGHSMAHVARLLLLAFTARNLAFHARVTNSAAEWLRKDLAGRLVLLGGTPDALSEDELRGLAARTLMMLLTVDRPDDPARNYSCASGAAAEWIGALVRADDALPRFDTAEFLEHVQVNELKRVATEAGVKVSGAAAAVRAALVGKLPDWRPAVFGAPGPVVVPERSQDPMDDSDTEDAA